MWPQKEGVVALKKSLTDLSSDATVGSHASCVRVAENGFKESP